MKFMKLVALATAVSCCLTGCSFTGDGILGKDKKDMNIQSTVTMDESNVNALSSGQIETVYVKEGDVVKKGDPLVLLNSDSLNAQRDQTKANIEKAEAALKQQQVTKAQAVAGKAKAQAAVEQTEAGKSQAEAGKSQAEAAVKSAQASYQSILNGANEEQLEQLRSAVKIAQTNVETSQTAFNDAETQLNRSKALYDAGGMSKVDYDKAQTAYTTAKNNLDNANQNLEIAKNKLKDTENGATQENKNQAKAGVDQAQASVAQAQAGVAQAQASVSQAEAGVTQADTSIAAADTAIEQAQASIKQLKISLSDIEKNIEKCTLKAPVDGVVTTVNVKKGDMVTTGLPTVVVTDTYNPYITCNIDEDKIGDIQPQQKVKIKLSATGDKTYEGTVTTINKQADFATKKASQVNGDFDILTYGIKVVFDDNQSVQPVLRAGMTSFVDFGK